jgi:hypothetical protein
MLSCGSLKEIGSFDSKRKPFGLFLGPFRGPFFHQGLEWFLFVLFLTVLAFTHISRSLYWGLIGCPKTMHRLSVFAASSTYTASLTTTAVFRVFSHFHTGFITSDFLLGYRRL